MAAKTPKIATMGNLIAAGLTFIVGITFSFMGGYARLNYGPDSQFAEFTVSRQARHGRRSLACLVNVCPHVGG